MLYDPKWEVEAPAKPTETWRLNLLKAADVIRQYGWYQGRIGNKQVGFCMIGAIRETIPLCTYVSSSLEARKVFVYLGSKSSIGSWNDRAGRTKEEVIAALEAAAKL